MDILDQNSSLVEIQHASRLSFRPGVPEGIGFAGASKSFSTESTIKIHQYPLGEWEAFTDYLRSLNFGPGCRDSSGYKAFLRAGSLGIRANDAVCGIAKEISANGGTPESAKLKSQLKRAFEYVGSQAGDTIALVKPPKTCFNPEKLRTCARRVDGIDSVWLRNHSPVSVESVSSARFLDHLYNAGEKIVVFTNYRSQGQALHTIGNAETSVLPAGSPEGVWFLVNPVDGCFHPNPRQEGRLSRRSEESITNWRYLVIENDEAPANEWLACLVQLPIRIVAIYTSGGRSIHALVRIDASSKTNWDAKKAAVAPALVTLGADEHALTAVRLSRLPGTLRGDRPQELLYLDPKADGTPIFRKGA